MSFFRMVCPTAVCFASIVGVNAHLDGGFTESQDIPVGQNVTYRCAEGFFMDGKRTKDTVVCVDGGERSGVDVLNDISQNCHGW